MFKNETYKISTKNYSIDEAKKNGTTLEKSAEKKRK